MENNTNRLADIKGVVHKLKTNPRFFGKTNMRWLELCFSTKLFGYKYDPDETVYQNSHNLREIIDMKDTVPNAMKKHCEWKYGFQVMVPNHTYTFWVQTSEQHQVWIAGLNTVLNKTPLSNAIPASVFRYALQYFAVPYYNELEKQRQKADEERLKKLREDMDRKRQEELRRKHEMEEKRRRDTEEEEQRRSQAEVKTTGYRLYGEDHEAIYRNADKEIEDSQINLGERNPQMKKVKKEDNELNFFADDLEFQFFDKKNTQIPANQLINFNPVLTSQNRKFGKAFHSVIRGYIDPTVKQRNEVHLENIHIQDEKVKASTHGKAYQQVIYGVSPILKSIIASSQLNIDDFEKEKKKGNEEHTPAANTEVVKPLSNRDGIKSTSFMKNLFHRTGTVNKDELRSSVVLLNTDQKNGKIVPKVNESAILKQENSGKHDPDLGFNIISTCDKSLQIQVPQQEKDPHIFEILSDEETQKKEEKVTNKKPSKKDKSKQNPSTLEKKDTLHLYERSPLNPHNFFEGLVKASIQQVEENAQKMNKSTTPDENKNTTKSKCFALPTFKGKIEQELDLLWDDEDVDVNKKFQASGKSKSKPKEIKKEPSGKEIYLKEEPFVPVPSSKGKNIHDHKSEIKIVSKDDA